MSKIKNASLIVLQGVITTINPTLGISLYILGVQKRAEERRTTENIVKLIQHKPEVMDMMKRIHDEQQNK